jgi:ribosomal protein L40E
MPRDSLGIDPNHQNSRAVLRFFGAIMLASGIILTAIGLISFFSAFGGGGFPRYFWAAFIGLPLTAIGAALLQFGYLGAYYRYFSAEVAPAARDTFNVMARETRPGVETVAHAMGRGLATGIDSAQNADGLARQSCGACHALNPADAKFCNQCGQALAARVCNGCGANVGTGSRFCNQCGATVA